MCSFLFNEHNNEFLEMIFLFPFNNRSEHMVFGYFFLLFCRNKKSAKMVDRCGMGIGQLGRGTAAINLREQFSGHYQSIAKRKV
jgi:hypothetical protein